jgi:hypothetical protein
MSIIRSLLALGLVLGTGVAIAAAPPNKQNQAKKRHSFHGVVVHVHHHKKGGGTIRVLVRPQQGRQGKSTLARGRQSHRIRTVHVTDTTQFEKIMLQNQGKNKGQAQPQNQKQPASFKDVHRGQHVRIKTGPRGHTALEVDIVHLAGGQGKRRIR